VGDLGITTIGDALRLRITDVTTVGSGAETNVRLTMGFETLAGTRSSTTDQKEEA
jgi:diaminohydroxyphosphoribosylaminopyrimidine deaminase/5-amino-6-(5-phosphoribosylamino)uracil reductase